MKNNNLLFLPALCLALLAGSTLAANRVLVPMTGIVVTGSPTGGPGSGSGGTEGGGATNPPQSGTPLLSFAGIVGNGTASSVVVPMGTTSNVILRLQNVGTGPASGVTVSLNAPSHIALGSHNCTNLAVGAECQVSLSVTNPTAGGWAMATVSAAVNAPGGGAIVADYTAYVAGHAPAGQRLTVSEGLSFGVTEVGSTSPVQTVTITNSGPLPISDIALGATAPTGAVNFGYSDNCGGTLAAGDSCQVNVSFTPDGDGPRAATLYVWSNRTGLTTSVDFAGEGVVYRREISVSTNAIDLGASSVGIATAASTFTITNTGNTTVFWEEVRVSTGGADFHLSNFICGSMLWAGQSCTVDVHAVPTQAGPRSGAVSVQYAQTPAVNIAVSATGVDVANAVTAAWSTAFPNPSNAHGTVPASANPGVVTYTNNSSVAVTLGAPTQSRLGGTATGTLTQTGTTCGVSLAAGASCAVNYGYAGANSGTALFRADIPVSFAGSGLSATTATASAQTTVTALVSPFRVSGNPDFGTVTTGTTATVTMTITNVSTSTVGNVYGIRQSAPQLTYVAGGCIPSAPVALAPGASCSATFAWHPLAVGVLRPANAPVGTNAFYATAAGNSLSPPYNFAGVAVAP